MSDPVRLTKATIKETNVSDNSTTSATQQKQTQTGISSAKDSFQVKQDSSLFTMNTNTGEVKFGDGVSGSRPPTGNSAPLLYQAKSEISGYLKGEAKTDFRGMKQYLLQAQNQQIDNQMKEAKERFGTAMNQANTEMATGIAGGLVSIGSAVDNLKHAALEAKSEVSQNPALELRYKNFTSLLHDFESASNQSQSKKMQQHANLADSQVKHLENEADKDSDFAKSSKAHKDHIRDAILDFIRKLQEIDPDILK